MSSARFNRLVSDAWLNNDTRSAIDAYNEHYISHCINPKRIKVLDSHLQQYIYIDVPCGSCYHCYESKINEWCTRMYAHAEDFKHVYFVTLTYRSFTDVNRPVNQLLLDKLSQAIWHKDSFNETKRYTYSPCLLVKKHYQDFIKRLRKYTGLNDLTYVLSGEYGSKYGRPHFHMILFTNGTLTKQDIVRAWSVCLWCSDSGYWCYRRNQKYAGTAYDFPIGRVDFHDLVSNGTFNTTAKIRVDGTYMNAANCFSYVCKYVCKRDKGNLSRVRLSYNALFHKETFARLYSNEIPFKIAKDWLLEHGIACSVADSIINNINLKKLSYEKTIFQPAPAIYEHGIMRTRRCKKQNYEYDEVLLPEVYFEYLTQYRPFCEFSRATAIGSLYAVRNIQEFTQDVYSKPILQQSGFVVPAYFRRKASEHLYGLRVLRKGIKSSSFNLVGLPYLYRLFNSSLADGCSPFPYSSNSEGHDSYQSLLQDSFGNALVDLSTRERVLFSDGLAKCFKYDRSHRDYVNTRSVPLSDYLRSWCVSILDELARYDIKRTQRLNNMRSVESALLTLSDLGLDTTILRDSFIKRTDEERKHLNVLYNEVHSSAE